MKRRERRGKRQEGGKVFKGEERRRKREKMGKGTK